MSSSICLWKKTMPRACIFILSGLGDHTLTMLRTMRRRAIIAGIQSFVENIEMTNQNAGRMPIMKGDEAVALLGLPRVDSIKNSSNNNTKNQFFAACKKRYRIQAGHYYGI